MNPSGLSFVSTWGILLVGVGIVFILFAIWCHNTSGKIDLILELLSKGERGTAPKAETTSVASGGIPQPAYVKAISPAITACIIGFAIILFFILPIWLLSR